MRKTRTKPGQYRKPVCVDVAPVHDFALAQPGCLGYQVDSITKAEDDNAICGSRESEPVDFVFGNEDPSDRNIEVGKLGDGHCEIGKAADSSPLIEDAKSQQDRLTAEAIADFEALGARCTSVDSVLRQYDIQQLAQQRSVVVLALDSELSTFEAADVLNVSRPHVTKLLERGAIPFRMVGTHHRIRLADVLQYQTEQRQRSLAAMQELADLSQELGLY